MDGEGEREPESREQEQDKETEILEQIDVYGSFLDSFEDLTKEVTKNENAISNSVKEYADLLKNYFGDAGVGGSSDHPDNEGSRAVKADKSSQHQVGDHVIEPERRQVGLAAPNEEAEDCALLQEPATVPEQATTDDLISFSEVLLKQMESYGAEKPETK